MKNIIVLILIALSILCLFGSYQKFQEYKILLVSIDSMNSKELKLKSTKETLLKISEKEPSTIKNKFEELINFNTYLNQYYKIESYVKFQNSGDRKSIQEQSVSTELNGIVGLPIEIYISNINDDVLISLILDSITKAQEELCFKVVQVDRVKNNISVKGTIYGLGEKS